MIKVYYFHEDEWNTAEIAEFKTHKEADAFIYGAYTGASMYSGCINALTEEEFIEYKLEN